MKNELNLTINYDEKTKTLKAYANNTLLVTITQDNAVCYRLPDNDERIEKTSSFYFAKSRLMDIVRDYTETWLMYHV